MGYCPECGHFSMFWDAELELWYCETYLLWDCNYSETEEERLRREFGE